MFSLRVGLEGAEDKGNKSQMTGAAKWRRVCDKRKCPKLCYSHCGSPASHLAFILQSHPLSHPPLPSNPGAYVNGASVDEWGVEVSWNSNCLGLSFWRSLD